MNWYKDRTIPLSEKWLNKLKKDLDESYIKHAEPWKQAGFNMDEKAWELLRKPIAELIDKSGSFLIQLFERLSLGMPDQMGG
jgi:hypothetical protein